MNTDEVTNVYVKNMAQIKQKHNLKKDALSCPFVIGNMAQAGVYLLRYLHHVKKVHSLFMFLL